MTWACNESDTQRPFGESENLQSTLRLASQYLELQTYYSCAAECPWYYFLRRIQCLVKFTSLVYRALAFGVGQAQQAQR